MIDHATHNAKLAAQLATVAAYRGSDLYGHFIGLLDCLRECYRDDLETLKPEHIAFKQGAAAQCRNLRAALLNASPDVTQIMDLPKV
jgi:hypothetical protein